jgi:hypothetical protein
LQLGLAQDVAKLIVNPAQQILLSVIVGNIAFGIMDMDLSAQKWKITRLI